ncbi:PorT family protein [Flavobacteriaceae bacterium GSB9]|nr:PorT family protein [Flavobacteriaceae bacterium GSB9]
MNKFNFSFFIGVLFSLSSLFAQTNFKIGANIGGQISSLRGSDNEIDNNFQPVPMIGLNVEVAFGPSISIITGINFERWKKEREFLNYGSFAEPLEKVNYSEGYDFYNIPFLFRYKFGNKKDFFVDAGGFVNYFNKGRPNRRYFSLFMQFEDYNFGVLFGVGKVFRITEKIDIALQLRDELGLTDVNKYEWDVRGEVMTNTIRMLATISYEL